MVVAVGPEFEELTADSMHTGPTLLDVRELLKVRKLLDLETPANHPDCVSSKD